VCTLYTAEYEERNKDNVPEPYIPPPEVTNRLAELLDEDDVGGANSVQVNNNEHDSNVVEAEVYAAVDHDADADLPPPPPPDYDPAFDQVTTTRRKLADLGFCVYLEIKQQETHDPKEGARPVPLTCD